MASKRRRTFPEGAFDGPAPKKRSLDGFIASCVEHGNNFVNSPDALEPIVASAPLVLKHRGTLGNHDCFRKIVPLSVWVFLCSLVNRNLRTAALNSTSRKTCLNVSVDMLIKWYGMMMEVETTYGTEKRNLRVHHSHIQAYFKGKGISTRGLGIDHFTTILNALVLEPKELLDLCKMLEESWISVIRTVSVVTIDESLISYKPSPETQSAAKDFIPVLTIPRKPHHTGLLLYLACSYLQNAGETRKYPFILGISPHVFPSDIGLAFGSLVSRTNTLLPDQRIHWVADAAFDVKENYNIVPSHHTYTISLNKGRHPDLLKPLESSLTVGNWIAMTCDNTAHIAANRLQDSLESGEVTKFIKTNNWQLTSSAVDVLSTPPHHIPDTAVCFWLRH